MQITNHFTYNELTRTNHTNFERRNRLLGQKYIPNMRLVCYYILEPIRARYGIVYILSCFRCLDLNRYIGSKDTSQHPLAQAVDFRVKNVECQKVFDYIRIKDCFKWGQLILYIDEKFIHLSLPTLEKNGQILIFKNGGYRRLK